MSTPVLSPEAHLFRQDVDAYYLALAARLGADIRQQTRIQSIEETGDGMLLDLGKEQIKPGTSWMQQAIVHRLPISLACAKVHVRCRAVRVRCSPI